MHDVHRDSLIHKKKTRKKKEQHDPGEHSHSHDDPGHDHEEHNHEHDDPHEHKHEEHSQDHRDDHDHDHDVPHGHSHDHDEEEYEGHDADLHTHKHHDHEAFGDRDLGDRAFAHLHEHEHNFIHRHHHDHHPEHAGIIHKVFKDPVRDWFAAGLMLFLIYAGYNQLLPGNLSNGMLVCAAIIGIFPVIKNALLECITQRRVSLELVIGVILLIGLFSGRFLEVAVVSLLMLVGSFMRVNFSWRNE
jgi:cation transport ATPase